MLEVRSITFLTIALLVGKSMSLDPRGMEQLTRCIKMAEPLVHNPDYIFPLTDHEIRGVCRMWDGFVDCVHSYTRNFLTSSQQHEFNRAIQSSIDSIHQLCVGEPDYRRSYVSYAPCLKRVSIEDKFCGGQYKYLADLVQGTSATDAQLCCAHHKFRDCVLDKTPPECDQEGVASGSSIPASRFMRDMLDRALGFLLQKCRNFVPNARDCPRTNVETTKGPTSTSFTWEENHEHGSGSINNNNNNNNPDFFGNGISNSNNNNNNNNNNNLRPDSTTSRFSSTTPPASTTRFTWTTKGSGLGSSTTKSSLDLTGNALAPESQQYRGGATGIIPSISSAVALTITLILTL